MNEARWSLAEQLADRPYKVAVETDTLSDGHDLIVLRDLDLPGLKAQGATVAEAKQALQEARADYIYALLELGLAVPMPTNVSSTTTRSETWVINVSTAEGVPGNGYSQSGHASRTTLVAASRENEATRG